MFFKKTWFGLVIYSSSHNHGSGKWVHPTLAPFYFRVIFQFHDSGRKGNDPWLNHLGRTQLFDHKEVLLPLRGRLLLKSPGPAICSAVLWRKVPVFGGGFWRGDFLTGWDRFTTETGR